VLSVVLVVAYAEIGNAQQQVPGGGRILEEAKPAPARIGSEELATQVHKSFGPSIPECLRGNLDGPTFLLHDVEISGNTVYSTEELKKFVAGWIGRNINAKQVNELCKRVTWRYRTAGYVVAEAVVTQQDLQEGILRLSVLEGRLGKIELNRASDTRVSEAMLLGILHRALPQGRPLTQGALERAMLLVTDLPGVAAESFLEAGDEPNTTNIVVEVKAAQRRYEASVEADNYGSRFNGEYRLGFMGRSISPLRLGDTLDLRAIASSGGGLALVRVGYDLPVGYSGTRVGAGVTYLNYSIARDFSALQANGNVLAEEITLTHPLLRRRAHNLIGKVSLEHKDLSDRFDAVSVRSDKQVRLLGAGLAYEARDSVNGGGYTNLGITAYLGNLQLDSPEDRAADESSTGRHTGGSFTKILMSASRLQALTERAMLFLSVAGQVANKDLDSAEQFALGGPNAVRAYGPSEALADEGAIATAEYRYTWPMGLTLSGFYDVGWGRRNAKPLLGDVSNERALRGYGLELYWGKPGNYSVRVSLAIRDSPAGVSDSRSPRVYGQVVKAF
jgi:hemolysin activation/secretion protein